MFEEQVKPGRFAVLKLDSVKQIRPVFPEPFIHETILRDLQRFKVKKPDDLHRQGIFKKTPGRIPSGEDLLEEFVVRITQFHG